MAICHVVVLLALLPLHSFASKPRRIHVAPSHSFARRKIAFIFCVIPFQLLFKWFSVFKTRAHSKLPALNVMNISTRLPCQQGGNFVCVRVFFFAAVPFSSSTKMQLKNMWMMKLFSQWNAVRHSAQRTILKILLQFEQIVQTLGIDSIYSMSDLIPYECTKCWMKFFVASFVCHYVLRSEINLIGLMIQY